MTPPPPLIDYRNVTVYRQGRAVLDRLSLTIPVGQHAAIIGPNGCGKSTFIKTITRELYPDPEVPDSYVEIFGKRVWNIFDLRHILGVVSYDWLQTCTRDYPSLEIVLSGFHGSVGIWPNHEVTPAMRQRAREVMELLEITHLADRPTAELSSGESRRVLIARALVHQPRALLLDEPTNSLDLRAMHELREALRRIARQGTSILLVTHHLPDILPEIERIILLRGGRVYADGAKQSILSSETLSELFGLPIEVERHDGYYHAW
jgi:iron complex transport system ATP-binding protein